MTQEIHSRIEREFTGYDDGVVSKLSNGQVCQQKRYKYQYKYAYRPKVRIYRDAGRYMMEVSGMNEPIEAACADVVVDGHMVSKSRGFASDARFEFNNGHVWEQTQASA